jgi:hypothetical protein
MLLCDLMSAGPFVSLPTVCLQELRRTDLDSMSAKMTLCAVLTVYCYSVNTKAETYLNIV